MIFIICSSFELNHHIPNEDKEQDKAKIPNDLIILQLYDLHKRVQHLELVEWKQTHNWFKNLFNISTAYETIDEMFEVKHEANIDDFGNLLLNYYNISTDSICSKYKYVVRSDCETTCIANCRACLDCKPAVMETKCGKVENFTNYDEAVKAYSTYPNQILNGEWIIRNNMKHFDIVCVEYTKVENYYENVNITGSIPVCLETKVVEQFIKGCIRSSDCKPWDRASSCICDPNDRIIKSSYCSKHIPINETNIIGYINYKHAYNTNDEQWLKQVIQQIINDNKHLYFEDYVKLFREKYYRITEDDERLYKLIRQEMKEFKAKNKQ